MLRRFGCVQANNHTSPRVKYFFGVAINTLNVINNLILQFENYLLRLLLFLLCNFPKFLVV